MRLFKKGRCGHPQRPLIFFGFGADLLLDGFEGTTHRWQRFRTLFPFNHPIDNTRLDQLRYLREPDPGMRGEEDLFEEALGNALVAIEGDFLFLLALDVIKRDGVVEIDLVLMETKTPVGAEIAFDPTDKGGRAGGTAGVKHIGVQAPVADQGADTAPFIDMPAITVQNDASNPRILIEQGGQSLRHAKGKGASDVNAGVIRTKCERILAGAGIFKLGQVDRNELFRDKGAERGRDAEGCEGQTKPDHPIGYNGPDIGKNAHLMAGGAQHTNHLPDKNNAMKNKDKYNRRDQGRDAIRDIGRQRIVIGKQDQSPDQDQVDA